MSQPRSKYDPLGLKVQRAQQEIKQIRGIGRDGEVTAEVDAENRLVALNVPPDLEVVARQIFQAYHAALKDKKPKLEAALQEYLADPAVEAVSTFVDANHLAGTQLSQQNPSQHSRPPAQPSQTTKWDPTYDPDAESWAHLPKSWLE